MSNPCFYLSRWIWLHHMRIVYVVAALFVVGGLAGPKYGAALAMVALLLARGGVALAVALWLVTQWMRRRTPGFALREIVAAPSRWARNSLGARAGYTALFLSLGVMFACLGGLIGTLGVYLVWRIA